LDGAGRPGLDGTWSASTPVPLTNQKGSKFSKKKNGKSYDLSPLKLKPSGTTSLKNYFPSILKPLGSRVCNKGCNVCITLLIMGLFSLLDDERERVFRIWAPHVQNLVAF
jgi:hypothetical protein